MKLTTLLLVIALLQVSAKGFSQVTVSETNVPAEKVMKAIEKQTGYVFIYDEAKVKLGMVSVDLHNAGIVETLNQLLKNLPVTYQIVKKNIVLQPKAETPARQEPQPSKSQSISVSGKVFDELNKPLPGVTVREKGSNNATETDQNGLFEITVTDNSSFISFSFIGFDTQELRAKDLPKPATIILKAASTNLKEVVVNRGYYNTTRELNTGNVNVVSSKEIEEQPISNPLAALQGRVPGLLITQQSGVPGAAFKVQIQGQNSISNGNDPFYVIDGVPYISELLPNLNLEATGGTASTGFGSPLEFINPSDIQDITILKDADATAIYGSRGANGVILITTKKGVSGKSKVDVNLYTGIGQVTRTIKWLNTSQYLAMRHLAFKNDGVTPNPSSDYDVLGGSTWDTTRNTDWTKKLIGGTAQYHDEQVSLSGGNENTQYMIGEGYHYEGFVSPGNYSDQKGSVHLNLSNTSLDKRFRLSLFANYIFDKTNSGNTDLTSLISNEAPDAPNPLNPDGSLNYANGNFGPGYNPDAYLLLKYIGNTYNLISNLQLSYNILKGLDIKSSFGYNNLQVTEISTLPSAFFPPVYGVAGSSQFTNNDVKSWIIEPQITYQTKLGQGNLNALIGSSFQENSSNGTILNANGYSSDDLLESLTGAGTITPGSTINTEYKYNALYGRLNYSYDDKYLVNFTARRDGSSRFGPGKQFGNFGAAGIGWIFSKESFISNHLQFLSFGKIRASYGTSGNDQIGDYQYLDLYKSVGGASYEGVNGLYASNLRNPNFAWELDKKLDVGLELGFFQEHIHLDVDYFRNRSSNQLVGYSLPAITGFNSVVANLPAVVQNTGLEFLINTVNIKTTHFNWKTSFNLTIPQNKLLSFPDLANSNYSNNLVIGEPLTIQKVYNYSGVNPTTGLYQFKSANGTLSSNPDYNNDRTILENTNPKFYGGLQNSISWNKFSLDFLFQFVKQTGTLYLFNVMPGLDGYNQPASILNNPNIQKISESYSNGVFTGYQNALSSSLVFGDASYIRLKNVSLSWTLPDAINQKIHIRNGKIYLRGQNLLTFTDYKGADPENQSPASLPPLRVYSLGIQLGL